MTDTRTPEYRALELDSSNDMIDHDGDRGLGRYERAARHMRQAGAGRGRMGQLMFEAGNYRWAATDWLCAADCFRRVPDLGQMRACLGRAQDLEWRGKVAPTDLYLFDALREREGQLDELERRLARFDAEYAGFDGAGNGRADAALDWLLGQVRELPGLPRLHARIAALADRLGRADLAAKHREWAEVFAADEARPEPAAVG